MHEAVLGAFLSIASGLAFWGLAAFIASVRPRLHANVAFALFALGFGGLWVTVGLTPVLHLADPTARAIRLPFTALWWLALSAMMFLFPVAVSRSERGRVLAAFGLGAAVLFLGLPAAFSSPDSWISVLPIVVSYSGLVAFLCLVTFRFQVSSDPRLRSQYALVTAAIAFVAAYYAGSGIHPEGLDSLVRAESWLLVWAVARFVAVLGVALAWLWLTQGAQGAMARNLALLIFSVLLIGLLKAAYLPTGGFGAIATFAMAALFTYAILRHQLLGVDVKVRWGVSKGVVAGIFLAVFFAVTELTKWFIENRFSGPGVDPALLGIAAAAMLLFAIAPLHRMADRVAARAVPVSPAPAVPFERREESYRRMLRRFLADEVMTRDEERALAELAADLEIDAGRAFALREEVEQALEAGPRAG